MESQDTTDEEVSDIGISVVWPLPTNLAFLLKF